MTQRSSGNSNVVSKAPGELELIDTTAWTRLKLLDAAIRPTLGLAFNKALAEQIAQQLQVHWGTVYRYRQRLSAEGTTIALLGRISIGACTVLPRHWSCGAKWKTTGGQRKLPAHSPCASRSTLSRSITQSVICLWSTICIGHPSDALGYQWQWTLPHVPSSPFSLLSSRRARRRSRF